MITEAIIGLTSGGFDLFHLGHLNYLQRCRTQCDKLIVAIDCDELVRKSKGDGRPIYPERERRLIVDALECVDITCILKDLSDLKHLSEIMVVNKVFRNNRFLDINPIIGVNGTSAELVIVKEIEDLPRTTKVIETIRGISDK